MPPITNKRDMYRLLTAGSLGNTIPQWFDVSEWERSADAGRYPLWGVRSLVPGGPCRLNCPAAEVRATAERPEFQRAGVNVSAMVDAVTVVTAWLEVYDSPTGLVVYGIEYPPRGVSWREWMPTRGRHWEGTAARMVLRKHLNPNSLDDLSTVLDRWPGHVVELSAVEGCFGTVPGRNGIVWEVRNY